MGKLEYLSDDPAVERSADFDFDGPPPPAYHVVAFDSNSTAGAPGAPFPMPVPIHNPGAPGWPTPMHFDQFPMAGGSGSQYSPQSAQQLSPPSGQASFYPRQGPSSQPWSQAQSSYAPLQRSSSSATSASSSYAGLSYAPSFRSANSPYSPSSSSSIRSPTSPSQSDAASLSPSSEAHPRDVPEGAASGDVLAHLLSPPPPCFSRKPPPDLPYGPFLPSALLGLSTRLEKGFPDVPPPSAAIPHPFVTHDVSEEDWVLFLQHVKAVAKEAPITSKFAADLAPRAMGFGLIAGLVVTKGVEMTMKGKKKGPVAQLIAQWNHYFFHPRQVDIALAQGRICYTGADEIPADMLSRGKSSKKVAQAHGADESDSDSERRHDEELQRQGQKMTRRNTSRNLFEFKKDFRGAANQVWRLVVSHKPYLL